MSHFERPQKVHLIGLENAIDVTAQFNPKELQIDESLDWKPDADKKKGQPDLSFGGAKGRSLSMELMFDTFEQGEDVEKKYLETLRKLVTVMRPDSDDENLKRPTLVKLKWPDDSRSFTGVIESLSTKLTMFLPSGVPVRATCTIKMKEASLSAFVQKGAPPPPPRKQR